MTSSSIFDRDTTYISIEQIRDSSTLDLTAIGDNTIKRYILEAERIVDNFIGSFWEKEEESQNTIFPTIDDWIPQDIVEATLYIVEALISYGNQTNTPWSQVVQETVGDHTVKYSEAERINSMNDLIPLKAKTILQQYWSMFYWQTLHQNNTRDVQWVFTANV